MCAKYKVGDRIIIAGSYATIVGVNTGRRQYLWSGLPVPDTRYAVMFDGDKFIHTNLRDVDFYSTGERVNETDF